MLLLKIISYSRRGCICPVGNVVGDAPNQNAAGGSGRNILPLEQIQFLIWIPILHSSYVRMAVQRLGWFIFLMDCQNVWVGAVSYRLGPFCLSTSNYLSWQDMKSPMGDRIGIVYIVTAVANGLRKQSSTSSSQRQNNVLTFYFTLRRHAQASLRA